METLKVTTERLPDCEVKLTVEIEPQHLERSLRQTARRLARRVRIPGFRPGKAPVNVIVRRFGKEALLGEVVESEGRNWYEKALEEVDFEPFGQAQLDIASFDPLIMTFTVPVEPMVNLEEYREIRIDWEAPTVSDEDVEKELARLQQEKASLEPRERPAEMEDTAILDVEGRIEDELVADLEERTVALNPDISYPVTGFAEKIVGMSPGEDREFTLTYPEDHPNAAWQGKEAHFKVHLHGVKVWVPPELDDELAKTMGDYETLDEWRAGVRERQEAEALAQAEQDYADQVVEALVEQAHIEFPTVLVERELDSMLEEMNQSLQQRGLGLDNFLVMSGQNREEYRESLREVAEKRIRRGLALGELVKQEALEVSEGEIEAEIDRLTEPLGDEAEDIRKAFEQEAMRESLRSRLLTQSAIDTLKTIARGEYALEATREEEEAEAEPEPTAESAEMLQEPAEEVEESVERVLETKEAEETTGEESPADQVLDADE